MADNLRGTRGFNRGRNRSLVISAEERQLVADLRLSGMSVTDYARDRCCDADRLQALERAIYCEEERARKKERDAERAGTPAHDRPSRPPRIKPSA